jgi:hypothetical protein
MNESSACSSGRPGPSLDPDVVTTMIQLLKERGSEPAVALAGEN